MKRIEKAKAVVDLASATVSCVVAVLDARARRREEERKAADEEKDRKIRELEAKLAEATKK